jgi:cob(I)alamin adenosyltransferase
MNMVVRDKPRQGEKRILKLFSCSKVGDEGQTNLLTGERVSKASLRPEACGALDEATSALGLAKAFTKNKTIRNIITAIQEDLIILGAELASVGSTGSPYRIEADQTLALEKWIEALQREVPVPQRFILPGANPVSAALDMARAIVRRVERRAVALKEAEQLDHAEVHVYLNRLGALLFTMARYAEKVG